METGNQLTLKRGFLYSLIGSVAVSALLGIATILSGDFGELQIRILLTTLTISAASVCGLSCGAALEAKRGTPLPIAGITLSVVSALLIIRGIWMESFSEVFWKITATTSVFAVATSHVSLLLLARLSPSYAWAKGAAHVVIFGVASVITAMVWSEFDDEGMFRLLGVAAILDAAISILIPVFHRLSRGDLEHRSASSDLVAINREILSLRSRLAELEQQKQRLESNIVPQQPAMALPLSDTSSRSTVV